MRTFQCVCGARLFFENTSCVACGREVGFLPEHQMLSAIEPAPDGTWISLATGANCRKCANNVAHGICNWMILKGAEHQYCQACELNNTIPDLSNPENVGLWAEAESAKRRLIYSINRLGLPLVSKHDSPERGVAFDILAANSGDRVMTGHADGLITLNLEEANAVVREQTRIAMNERYRTMLGHFRHEIGHYYWQILVDGSPFLEEFRERFGDERADYSEALDAHYNNDSPDVGDEYISTYASAHPWEDWAEVWAHYLHIVGTFESAWNFGLVPSDVPSLPANAEADFDRWIAAWQELTVVLNELNRSMGLPDAYPFELSLAVIEKLRFVHRVVANSGRLAEGVV